ncbi:alpha/beta hydrolase fold domain-containing protein [Curtobacterium sp. NPDC089689]|uniref:alpha/beta hydrolase fold domain-containing protein n=1 Tax=Curtobacterium sp. NPDC089689 TaxID=3363968 RepID=UPI00382D9D02
MTIRIVNHTIDADAPVSVRVYEPEHANGTGLLWMHGGAFIHGDLDIPEADATSRYLAERGITVVSVDYRLAVDGIHFPIPLEDCLTAWQWCTGPGNDSPNVLQWAVGGGSAGGNLAAALAVRLRDEHQPLPAGSVLVYPVLHAVPPEPDPELAVALEALTAEQRFDPEPARELSLNYAGDEDHLLHPWVFPGHGTGNGLPPTLIITSDVDSLRPSGERYAALLTDADTPVTLIREHGSLHGHLNYPTTAEAQRTLQRTERWLTALTDPHAMASDDASAGATA